MEAKHLLSVVLAIPSWRGSLDLACEEAMSVTAVLLEEETAALNRTAASAPVTKVTSAVPQLSRTIICRN